MKKTDLPQRLLDLAYRLNPEDAATCREAAEVIERLTKENATLSLKARVVDRLPLCPDHRDKVAGKPCLQCRIGRLTSLLQRLQDVACEEDCEDIDRVLNEVKGSTDA